MKYITINIGKGPCPVSAVNTVYHLDMEYESTKVCRPAHFTDDHFDIDIEFNDLQWEVFTRSMLGYDESDVDAIRNMLRVLGDIQRLVSTTNQISLTLEAAFDALKRIERTVMQERNQ